MSWTSGNGHSADTGEQQGEVYNAIVSVSQAAKVDPRLILATIIQEVSSATACDDKILIQRFCLSERRFRLGPVHRRPTPELWSDAGNELALADG